MLVDTLIRGGTVVLPDQVCPLDVAIDGEKIVALDGELQMSAREVIDATGLHVFPGGMDAHVHFNEPGRTAWEGIETGSASLAAGGGTCFFDMPLNSDPPTLNRKSFDQKLAAGLQKSVTDFGIWGGLTPHNLSCLEELAECGVVGFKAFLCDSGIAEFPRCDDWSLYQGMELAAQLDLPVAVHAENQGLTQGLAARQQESQQRSANDYLASRPVIAEREAIQRVLLMAAETGARLHVVHVSHPQCVQDIRSFAATHTIRVTCETCPHYLLLQAADCEQLGAIAKCAPPLRTESDRQALLELLLEGWIDTIGSDHSPAPPQLKGLRSPANDDTAANDVYHAGDRSAPSDYFQLWGGISGVQISLHALLTLGVPPQRVAQLMSHNVAKAFRIANKGNLAQGMDADLSLVDLRLTFQLSQDMLWDRHRLSPYLGRVFRGGLVRTMVRGKTVFREGQLTANAGGRLVVPTRSDAAMS